MPDFEGIRANHMINTVKSACRFYINQLLSLKINPSICLQMKGLIATDIARVEILFSFETTPNILQNLFYVFFG